VTYLNQDWRASDGGELVLYQDEADKNGLRILPEAGTVVLFLSDEFPHEVLPAKVDRYSIAGWFRVNASSGRAIDPPR
jgi:SM-20-related protein